MIKYALTCAGQHEFESWFRDSAAFDALADAGQLSCPICGSAKVAKALMAPSLVRGRSAGLPQVEPVRSPEITPPAAPPGDPERQLRAQLRELHRHIKASADDVGRAFPAEARRIHEGEAPSRAIYGQATGEEVKSLLDDGVAVLPMPPLPDDHH